MSEMEFKKELDEIKNTLHHIEVSKQERIKPVVWVPFLMWLIIQTIAGSWWAATTTTNLVRLAELVEQNTSQQYTVGEADRDFRQRDQFDQFLQTRINDIRKEHVGFRERLKELEKHSHQLGEEHKTDYQK